MKGIVKYRWFVFVAWIVLAVGLFFMSPDLGQLVHDKGQLRMPDGSASMKAAELLAEVNGEGTSAVFVFHDENGLDDQKLIEVKSAVELLKNNQEKLGLTSVMSHFDQPDLAEQMVSSDGKTVLVLLGLESEGLSTNDQRDALYEALKDVKVDHYLTGSSLIDEDVVISSQEGVKRTELITVGFILIILILVFRSIVTPFIPLLTIGISYMAAQSVVAYLVDYADFPLSTFTQIFMVAVMFGIGTDYCILLISRFKEELAERGSKVEAIVYTYRTAGKTVIFSGIAVLVGFIAIGFSKFILYQSAVAVAVGVTVMLAALFTLMPFFMAVLGRFMFWPGNRSLGHKDSRLWGAAGSFSLRRPLLALLIIAAAVVPFLAMYDGDVSYNMLDEIGESYDSVKGFQIISDSFGPGDSLPTTVAIKHDEPLDNERGMAWIEKISRELLEVDGVRTVRSATRPTGEPIAELSVSDQAAKLQDGLSQGTDGIVQIRDGLATAGEQLVASKPKLLQAGEAAAQLADGTAQVIDGLQQLTTGLAALESGVRDGAIGASELKNGLVQIRDQANLLRASYEQLRAGYEEISGGITALSAHYARIEDGLNGIAEGLNGLDQLLQAVAMSHPELSQDMQFQSALGIVAQLKAAAAQLAGGLKELNAQMSLIQAGLREANAGFGQATAGHGQLNGAFDAVIAGLNELEQGLKAAADGHGQIAANVPGAVDGLKQIEYGQRQLQAGFAELEGQLAQLTDGLLLSSEGLTAIGDGLMSAVDYLNTLSENGASDLAGWNMPEEVLTQDVFKQVLNAYMSEDRKIAKFDVIFESHPYAGETLDLIDDVNAAVERAIKGTPLEVADYAAGGVTSMYRDLRQVSQEDFSRTAVIMLIGIFLVLAILLRSIIMPVYLLASLLLTYYTSMAVAEWIFVDLAGYDGTTWAVPFFAFVMLVALGIDYSIFLMGRFNEYKHLDVKEAILESMKKMGSVIFSAVIILGGTFAAMLPSGVLSLLQIATIVLTGLVLYALVFLPLFIPMMVRLFGQANWWPFHSQRHGSESSSQIGA